MGKIGIAEKRKFTTSLTLVQPAVLVAAIMLAVAEYALAFRQMDAALGTANHVFAPFRGRGLFLPDASAISFQDDVDKPDASGQKQ